MKLTYVGPHVDGVNVPLEDGREIPAPLGKPADIPAHIAVGLLEQPSNWQRAPLPLERLNKTQLEQLAAELELELPDGATKAVMIETIEAAQAEAGESDGS